MNRNRNLALFTSSIGKLESMINIVGLATGISIFIVGLVYSNHERSYDKGYGGYSNIFRIEILQTNGKTSLVTNKSITEQLAGKFSGIEFLTTFNESSLIQPLLKSKDNSQGVYISHLFYTDSNFFKIFDYPFLYGNVADAFLHPNSIIISLSLSQKLFKKSNPVGKTIISAENGEYIVSGVYTSAKYPSHIAPEAVQLAPKIAGHETDPYGYCYIKLKENGNKKRLEHILTESFNSGQTAPPNSLNRLKRDSVSLRSIASIHLFSHSEQELSVGGNSSILMLINCICALLLVTASINFTNYMIAIAPSKAKGIAIRRILGSTKRTIFKKLYLDAFIKCLIAFVVAFIILLLAFPLMKEAFPDLQYSLTFPNWLFCFQLIAFLLCLTFVTGTYPAIYLNMFKPVETLKGYFNNSVKGNKIRNILLILQITITCVFITGFIIISSQISFLRTSNLGFVSDQVMVALPNQIQTQFKYDYIKNEILTIPGVQGISYSSTIGSRNDKTSTDITFQGEIHKTQYISVDTNYLNILSAHFVAGSNFSDLGGDSSNVVIINRELAAQLNIKDLSVAHYFVFFGKSVRINGIVDNLKFYGFKDKPGPMVFTPVKYTLAPFLLIKLTSKNFIGSTNAIIEKWKNIEPGYPMRYYFMSETVNLMYKNYEYLRSIFILFAVCSILLAVFGVYSVMAAAISQKSKELAIRRVLGATFVQIVILLNKQITLLAIIGTLLAWPISYYLAALWLNNFFFKISLSFTPLLYSGIFCICMAIFITTIQSIRTVFHTSHDILKHS